MNPNAQPLTRDEWVAQALRCYDAEQLPNVCWDNIFHALCEEVIALRGAENEKLSKAKKRTPNQKEGKS